MRPPELAVATLFRDSQAWYGRRIDQVTKFFKNMDNQASEAGVKPQYFVLEGDSRDNTRAVLERMVAERDDVTLIRHDVGGRPPSSDGGADRLAALSEVGNACLRPARDSGAKNVLWMESDLIPEPGMLKGLMEAANSDWWKYTLAVAPVTTIYLMGAVVSGDHKKFYDGFAYEGPQGERWSVCELASLVNYPNRYRRMRSIGSCAILNGKALRRFDLDYGRGCFPKLCQSGREMGLTVYCDVTLECRHPSSDCLNGRWV